MKKQEHATHAILELTLQLVKFAGRPRKLPGKPRPLAVFHNGYDPYEVVNPRRDYAQQYSTEGAVIAAAYFYRDVIPAATLSRARKMARSAIIDALNDYGYNITTLREADDKIADTRMIVRALKSAEKSWRPINA